MRTWGFRRGKFNPCMHLHGERGIKVLIHGDDFVAVESREDLAWFEEKLRERFDVKTSRLGLGNGEEREGRVT